MKKLCVFACLLLVFTGNVFAQSVQLHTYTNPLLPSGADPWVIYKDGFYYYTNSTGNGLVIWKTQRMEELNIALRKVVWTPPAGTAYSKEIWAPELHFLHGRWYMYFSADDGNNAHHRLYVVENSSPDPMTGKWNFKGRVGDSTDKWAIDASVFENKGKLYMLWSGWEGDVNGQQNIYIAVMKNPFTVAGERVKISAPVYDWEKYGDLHDPVNPPHVNVNEGPEILKHGNKIFLVYSASGCWTDHYCLGMLVTSASANLMDAAAWKKLRDPVFKESKANGVYAPGHNSFFKSPDGKEDWIIYHANPKPGCGCDGQRSPRMQRFSWRKDGMPDFGVPVKVGIALKTPD